MAKQSLLDFLSSNLKPVDGGATYIGTFSSTPYEGLFTKQVGNRPSKSWPKAQFIYTSTTEQGHALEKCIEQWLIMCGEYKNQYLILDDNESSNQLLIDFEGNIVAKNDNIESEIKNILGITPVCYAMQNKPLQVIYFGAPGTGKSHRIKQECKKHEHYRITFHPDTDYASFVGSYKPITHSEQVYTNMGDKAIALKDSVTGEAITTTKITYKYVYQAFLNAYIAAWKEQQNEGPKPVFLVIEEINRGNCAQIFGDIFQLLDRNDAGYSDYPIVTDNDLKKELENEFADLSVANREAINALYEEGDVVGKVIDGSRLLLPNNLYIWATMNTSDQSLFPIDSAFKRRWEWKYIKIADSGMNYIISVNGNEYDWWDFVNKINDIIGSEIEQEDKKLGYFFAKTAKGADGRYIISADKFLSKVIFFLYNDVFKDFGFEYDFFKDKDGKVILFADYFNGYGDTDEAKVETFIKNLGLSPAKSSTGVEINDDSRAEESASGNKKIKIGNVEEPLRRTPLEITRQALAKQSLTLGDLRKAAEKSSFSSTQLQNLFLPLNQKESWLEAHEADSAATSRYHFSNTDTLTDANGEKFMVWTQWAKTPETVNALKKYAAQLNVPANFPE